MPDLEQRIRLAVSEPLEIVPYDPGWPERFELEKRFLLSRFASTIRRIEHFGSTAVPGMAAKPVIDMLVGVSYLDEVKRHIVPHLAEEGYDYFWRPTAGSDTPPWYAWFIKRNGGGIRTHHIHMVEPDFREHWKRLLFRDYLRSHPQTAAEYESLKRELAAKYSSDRAAYSEGKAPFIMRIGALMEREDESSRNE
jgi:GrpB-like predicted nucleotidyltransferase (UPF0157 family)